MNCRCVSIRICGKPQRPCVLRRKKLCVTLLPPNVLKLKERAGSTSRLNQSLRRLRTTGEEQVLNLLAESCAPYAERLVVLVFENNQARCAASAGVENADLTFDTVSAPAIVAAIDSRDPVVALATEAEISPVLARGVSRRGGRRRRIFSRSLHVISVVAMLVASGYPCIRAHRVVVRSRGHEAGSRWTFSPRAQVGEAPAPRAWEELGVRRPEASSSGPADGARARGRDAFVSRRSR